jgi:hypothetical protein
MTELLIALTKTFTSNDAKLRGLGFLHLKRMPEAFIFTNKTNPKSMNKKLVLIILVIVIVIGLSATLIAVNPSSTILPIPTPPSLHNRNESRSNLHGANPA